MVFLAMTSQENPCRRFYFMGPSAEVLIRDTQAFWFSGEHASFLAVHEAEVREEEFPALDHGMEAVRARHARSFLIGSKTLH
jgi:hypothetical protein